MQSKSTSDFTTAALHLLRQAGAAALRAARLTGRWLERLFVHRLMRMAVENYDKRHGRQPAIYPASNGVTDKLREQLTRITAERDELATRERHRQQCVIDAESKAAALKQEYDRLSVSLHELRDENAKLHDKLSRLSTIKADYDYLVATAAAASMLLYAEADATEPSLRKTTVHPVQKTQYVLTTLPGKPNEATFRIYETADHTRIIACRSVALLACDVKSIAASPTRVVNIEPGTARLENGTWRVTKKAAIHLE